VLEGVAAAPAVEPERAILATAVGKTFVLPHERYTTVRDRLLHPLTAQTHEELEALRGVSFEVRRGEFFGIVGKNGSGKSTLLRCLAGIYPADTGAIDVHGRLAPFIELGVGFNPDLAARDNAIANAVMFGLSRKEAAARVPEMLRFAELERFADQTLKNYSTGMAVRLAFAVTTHVDADVLLFDEVLAVGDAAFQEKCLARFEELRVGGKTVVLVSHEMEYVRDWCDRAMMLDHGVVVAEGDAAEIADEYEELNRTGAVRVPHPVPVPAATATGRPHSPLLGPDLRRFWTLTQTLAVTEFKLKYAGTTLNWLWAVGRPLVYFGALLLVREALGRFTHAIDHYAAYLLLGIVLWTFFAQCSGESVLSLKRRSELLRKLPFPHLAVPLSIALTAFLDLCVNLAVALPLAIAFGVDPQVGWLELPLLVAVLGLLTVGTSLLLSSLYVRFRDVDQIWQVAGQTLFWLTPIFYAATSLSPRYARALVMANPIATVITQVRHAVVDPSAPSAAAVAGGWEYLLVPLGIVLATFALGLAVFRRESPRAAQYV